MTLIELNWIIRETIISLAYTFRPLFLIKPLTNVTLLFFPFPKTKFYWWINNNSNLCLGLFIYLFTRLFLLWILTNASCLLFLDDGGNSLTMPTKSFVKPPNQHATGGWLSQLGSLSSLSSRKRRERLSFTQPIPSLYASRYNPAPSWGTRQSKIAPMLNYLRTMPWSRRRDDHSWSCTRWRWEVSFTPLPFHPGVKRPWYPLDRRLGGTQEQRKIFASTGNRKGRPACSPSLWRLNYSG
jgi:hypothetical protein